MADNVNAATRSRMMRSIRGRDTVPELTVRRFLHGAGLRFRLGGAGLPGRPDVVLPRHRVALFVHGCFWHRHDGCKFTSTPATNVEFWTAKFASNVARDAKNEDRLRALGWEPIVIWECEARDVIELERLVWRIVICGEVAADGISASAATRRRRSQ